MTIEVTINGQTRAVEAPATIGSVLAQFGLHERIVVVERNGHIIRRESFAETSVEAGDVLEIVQMMAGG